MAKDTKAGRDAKASEEWDGVAPTSFDLKALVANVALASSNNAKVKRASAKSNKKAAKALREMVRNRVRSEEKREALADEAIKINDKEADRHDKAQELQLEIGSKLIRVENLIKEGIANPKFVGKNQIARIRNELKELETLVSKLTGDDRSLANERVDDIYVNLDELDKLIQEVKKTNKPVKDVANKKKANLKKFSPEYDEEGNEIKTWSNLVDRSRDDDGVVGIRKSAANALRMLGSKAAGSGMGLGKKMGKGVTGALGYGINKLLDANKDNPKTLVALKAVGKSVKWLGGKIETVGSETFKWVGKKLGQLAGWLSSFLRSPLQSVGGIGNLLGLAALGTMVIKPILEGIDAELKSRFGEDYISKFISSLWSKAWGYLVNQIKSFLGIGGGSVDNTGNSDPGTTGAPDGALTSSGAEAGAIVNSTTSLTPAQEATKEKALKEYRAALDSGSFMQRTYQIGLTAEQKAAKTRYELAVKGELKDSTTWPQQASPESATSPAARSRTGSQTGPTTSVTNSTTSPSTSVTNSTTSPSTSVTNSSTTSTQNQASYSNEGRGAIAVPAESGAPMDGPKNPIVAKPSVSSPEVTSVPNAGSGGGRGGGSPGVTQVPTWATSEAMHLKNVDVM